MSDPNPELHQPASMNMEGEHMGTEHIEQIKDGWLSYTIENVEPLLASDTEFLVFEPHNSDKPNIDETVQLPVEHHHGLEKKTKVILSAAAVTTLTGFGIAVLMRGRFSPKARKNN